MRLIPLGQVATYGQVAAVIGHRGAARTVGWALHALQADSNVPWHRVVNARGRISTGGHQPQPSLQQVLLKEEGVPFSGEGQVDLQQCRWDGPDWPEVEALRHKGEYTTRGTRE